MKLKRISNPYAVSDYDPAENWAAKANCSGKAIELFEYQEKDSPLAEGMNFKERLAFNHANFELASEICIECPVMIECGRDADEDQKYWTVRGGEMPGRYAFEKAHYDSLGRPKARGVDRVCDRGHLVPGGGRCPTCKKATNNRARAKKRLAQGQQVV